MELFRLVGRIAVEGADKANSEIGNTTDIAAKACEKLGNVVQTFGRIAIDVGIAATAALGATATAIGALTKSAVESYADYEQLVGGVETLFKDSSDRVLAYANNAYRTAGLSANQYMETVTSFSASLLQSLDGDTALAADIGNRAIEDMADNANKMGTSMESIQNAYQGFAKQNYTMLDNLKLGYGGTKDEMERLIYEASNMTEEMEALGISVDSTDMSFANIVNAISVVQKHLDFTGTTAKEAAGTISGSIGMMKAAWKNFLTGMADGTQDADTLVNNLVDSVITATNNVVPRFIETVPRIVEGLESITDNIIPQLVPIINQIIPTVHTSIVSILQSVFDMLPDDLKEMLKNINESMDFASGFEETGRRFKVIWDSIVQPVIDFAVEYFYFFRDNVSEVFTLYQDIFEVAAEASVKAWDEVIEPIFEVLQDILEQTFDMIIENMPFMMESTRKALDGMIQAWEKLQPTLDVFIKSLNERVLPTVKFVFEKMILPITEKTLVWIATFISETLIPVFVGLCEFLSGVFTLDFEMAMNGIQTIADTILGGMKDRFVEIFEEIKTHVSQSLEYIKNLFNFEWSLPTLKVPHVSVNGGSAPWGIGGLGELPSFSVDWYAKAMDKPIIMDKPTAFGVNSSGQVMAGGEAGSEVVSGTDTLMKMISGAVDQKNNEMINVLYMILNAIMSMDEDMGSKMKEALEDTSLKIGNREFARLVKAVV